LPKQKAQEVLTAAKKQFRKYAGAKLGSTVEAMTSESLQKGMGDIKKEVGLQMDLKFMEQKSYTDKRYSEIKSEVESLKSEVTDLKIGIESKLKTAVQQAASTQTKGATQRLLYVLLLIIGIYSIYQAWTFVPSLASYIIDQKAFDAGFTNGLIVFGVLALIAIVCIIIGGRGLVSSLRKYSAVGVAEMFES
jgi:cell division protein FtsB